MNAPPIVTVPVLPPPPLLAAPSSPPQPTATVPSSAMPAPAIAVVRHTPTCVLISSLSSSGRGDRCQRRLHEPQRRRLGVQHRDPDLVLDALRQAGERAAPEADRLGARRDRRARVLHQLADHGLALGAQPAGGVAIRVTDTSCPATPARSATSRSSSGSTTVTTANRSASRAAVSIVDSATP